MKKTQNIFLLILLAVAVTACKKDYDSPPVKDLPTGNIISIDSLRNMYVGIDSIIDLDLSIYGIVTADERSGNIYKTLFIQDETNAIKLELTSSSSNTFFIGDKIRVSLKGAKLYAYKNMIAVADIDPEKNLIKQLGGQALTPEVVSIDSIDNLNGVFSKYQAKLVRIDDVEFQCSDLYSCPGVLNTWANAIDQSDESRLIEDTLGNSLIVRSSGYASFVNQSLPMGKGSIIGVVSQYNGDIQLTIRDPKEGTMNGARFINCAYLQKDFNDQDLLSCGWTTHSLSGTVNTAWEIYAATNSAASVSNYDGSAVLCESWLISPSINLVNAVNPDLNFRNVVRYDVLPPLNVMISTDYDGVSNPNTATWTDLTSLANWDSNTGTWSSWTSSGSIDLNAFKQANVHIAFRLIGSTSNSSTWEIDDVIVQDN
ncbi:MAG: choice-of-anchor J domain-containing protein [Flavobacteriales bacterium]|nr:choice-of-anchor J domain-containing protein [Flavobacteriales bacterium]